MRIELSTLTRDNWLECARLELAPGQEKLVASNMASIAESRFEPHYEPRAIYADGEITGFLMYSPDQDGPEDGPECERSEDLEADVEEVVELERAAAHAVGWSAILLRPAPAVRRMLLVGVGIAVLQQACGIDSIMFYLMFVIRQSGITGRTNQSLALILLGTVKLAFVFVGARLFDEKGRRPLLFTSLIGAF